MRYRTLCENHLYRKVFAENNRAGSRTVTVYILKDLHANRLKKENPEKKKINRVGISVSKKLGGAVVRNRAKRVIREGYRGAEKQRPLKKGYLIVIVPRSEIVFSKSPEVCKDLVSCFERLGMFE